MGWHRILRELQTILQMILINCGLQKTVVKIDGNILHAVKCSAVEIHSELSVRASQERLCVSLGALLKKYAQQLTTIQPELRFHTFECQMNYLLSRYIVSWYASHSEKKKRGFFFLIIFGYIQGSYQTGRQRPQIFIASKQDFDQQGYFIRNCEKVLKGLFFM